MKMSCNLNAYSLSANSIALKTWATLCYTEKLQFINLIKFRICFEFYLKEKRGCPQTRILFGRHIKATLPEIVKPDLHSPLEAISDKHFSVSESYNFHSLLLTPVWHFTRFHITLPEIVFWYIYIIYYSYNFRRFHTCFSWNMTILHMMAYKYPTRLLLNLSWCDLMFCISILICCFHCTVTTTLWRIINPIYQCPTCMLCFRESHPR